MNGFYFIKTNFGQDLQDFLDIYFYFFPDERNKYQSASRNSSYDLRLSKYNGLAPSAVKLAVERKLAYSICWVSPFESNRG
jgi:hypothetical protein